MSFRHMSEEMQKIHDYVPEPRKLTLNCQLGIGSDATKCNLPIELRWSISPSELYQIWLLCENVMEAKYDWDIYKTLLENSYLTLAAFTTTGAYRRVMRNKIITTTTITTLEEEQETLCAAAAALNADVTAIKIDEEINTLTKEEENICANTKFDLHKEYLKLPSYTDEWECNRVNTIREELNKLLEPQSIKYRLGSFFSRILNYFKIQASPEIVLRNCHSHDNDSNSNSNAESNTNSFNERNEQNSSDEYNVCIGFISGTIGYASIDLETEYHSKEYTDKNIRVRSKQSNQNKPLTAICINPTGYIGLIAVLPYLHGCGVGSVMLQTYLSFMMEQMPLHANTYLHYDIHRMELLVSSCQENKKPITATTTTTTTISEPKYEESLKCDINDKHANDSSCTKKKESESAEQSELCNIICADELNPVVQLGVREVWLHCFAENDNVISFYLKNGFAEVKRKANYYDFDEHHSEAVMMLYRTPAAKLSCKRNCHEDQHSTEMEKVNDSDANYKTVTNVNNQENTLKCDVSTVLLKELYDKNATMKSRKFAKGNKQRPSLAVNKDNNDSAENNDCESEDFIEANAKLSNTEYRICERRADDIKRFHWLTPFNYHLIDDIHIEPTKACREKWVEQRKILCTVNESYSSGKNSNGKAKNALNTEEKNNCNNNVTYIRKDASDENTWKD